MSVWVLVVLFLVGSYLLGDLIAKAVLYALDKRKGK